MREGMSGSLIYKLDPLAPASKSLCLNDVVLAIEDVPIADDSTIEFREEERVEFTYHVRNKHVGALLNVQRFMGRRTARLALMKYLYSCFPLECAAANH